MEYHPFVLRIADVAGGLAADVLKSPSGEGYSTPFSPPLTAGDLARLATVVEAAAASAEPPEIGPSGAARLRHLRPEDDAPPPPDLLDLGRRLSEALFAGPVAGALRESLGRVRAMPGAGLRIEVRIAPSVDPQRAALLHALPWELLLAPGRDEPLVRGRDTPVVRYLEVQGSDRRPLLPGHLMGGLRVVVAAPRPAGLPPLAQDVELTDLRRAFDGGGAGAEIVPLEPPTLERLREVLREQPVHGFHFMGHGRMGPETGTGELLFETPGREPDPVSAALLADQVEDFAATIRFAVLNACESGRSGAVEPAAGVAAALVGIGVPAVVAMRFPVSDRAAVAFGRALYARLAAGEPVEAAVAEGRSAIRRDLRGSPEWLTPALFLRTDDGRLFAVPEAEAKASGAGEERPRPSGGRWVAGVAALLIAAAMVAGGLAWLGPEPGEPPAGAAATGEVEEEPPGRPGGPREDVPEEASAEVAEEPPAGGAVADAGSGAGEAGTPPRTSPLRSLGDGESLELEVVPAVVSVDFLEVEGQGLVRLIVSPEGGDLLRHALFGPETVTFDTPGGPAAVDVLGIDRRARTVELRVRRIARR